MFRLQILILFLAFFFRSDAQDTLRVCMGSNQEFGVPPTVGSTYYWQVDDSTVANIVAGNGTDLVILDINDADIFKLIVRETDINGCIGYDSVLIDVFPLPEPIITASAINFCEGDSVLIQLDSIYDSFIWNNSSNLNYIYGYVTGTYFVTVTDTNGCSNSSDSVFITAYSNPIADFSSFGFCVDLPSLFINESTVDTNQLDYTLWYLGDEEFVGDSIYYTYHDTGEHEVSLTIRTNSGCRDSVTKNILIFDNPEADFDYNPKNPSILTPEVNFIHTSVDAIPIYWDFGDTLFSLDLNPTHIYDNPGIYDVMLVVEDSKKCLDSITKKVIMYYDFILHVPNAFTPNDDGYNDVFFAEGLRMEKYRSYELKIYNSWGEVIFQTDDIGHDWDGGEYPEDVYNWLIIITDELGEVRKRNGVVNLIR